MWVAHPHCPVGAVHGHPDWPGSWKPHLKQAVWEPCWHVAGGASGETDLWRLGSGA